MNLSAATMNLPPEKKKRKTKSSSPPPSFSLLPDEIIVNYLARIPRSYYPRLSSVCKSFHSIISSTELYTERSYIGSTEQCLYVFIWDYSQQNPQWFTLYQNPNRTLPNSSVTKKTIGKLLVPIPPTNFPAHIDSTIAVGSEIYVIGGPVEEEPSSAVRILNGRSHTWRDAPNIKVSREHALSCVYNGKIYVMGGCKRLEDDEPWAEVFDTKTQTWEWLPDPGTDVRNRYVPQLEEREGKIYIETQLHTYAYDTKQGKWERCERESTRFPRSKCVVENALYRYNSYGKGICQWCEEKDEIWKVVKGLDSLRNKCRRNGGSRPSTKKKLVSYGGRLLLMWEGTEGYTRGIANGMKKIWCAEIVLEKCDGGEVWGNVEWVGVVHTVRTSCVLFDCLAVSV